METIGKMYRQMEREESQARAATIQRKIDNLCDALTEAS